MFGIGGTAARRRDISAIASRLQASVSAGHETERATVLLLANYLLGTLGISFVPELATDPREAPAKAVSGALAELFRVRAILLKVVADQNAPHLRQSRCYLKAHELVLCTVGLADDPSLLKSVAFAWKAVWDQREHLPRAVTWLRHYEAEAQLEAVPRMADGSVASDLDLLRIGRAVPPFIARLQQQRRRA